jgi:sphinganine-1-phosphate aldolase
VDQVDVLLGDLDAALTAARALTPVRVDPGLAELAAGFDLLTMGPDEVSAVLAFAGLGGAGDSGNGDHDGGSALPDRMAPVLVLLNALPAPLKERLLTEFVGSVFRI